MPQLSPPDYAAAGPGRLASQIRTDAPGAAAIALLGMPDDTGVSLNGGRPGAAQGPAAIRAALCRYGSADAGGVRWPVIYDAGDIKPGADIHETHDRVTDAASDLAARGMTVIGLGGGHDLTFALVRGVAKTHGVLSGVYFDAHLDVRAETGSGMPFRAVIEHKCARRLTVHGLDPMANSGEHLSWFTAHGGHVGADALPDDPWPEGPAFVSLDLDVIDQSCAPGVSAMNPCGWTPALAERWCRAAGANRTTRCFDIMELSPPHDENGRTARLAARMLLAFLAGFGSRSR